MPRNPSFCNFDPKLRRSPHFRKSWVSLGASKQLIIGSIGQIINKKLSFSARDHPRPWRPPFCQINSSIKSALTQHFQKKLNAHKPTAQPCFFLLMHVPATEFCYSSLLPNFLPQIASKPTCYLEFGHPQRIEHLVFHLHHRFHSKLSSAALPYVFSPLERTLKGRLFSSFL